MPSMIDAQCPKCRKRFGWSGRMVDKPACPRCGHADPREELEAADQEMDELRRLLASRPSANVCRKQRVCAGLTLHQAAKQLDIAAPLLADYEHARRPLPDDMVERMREAYGLNP